MDRRPPPNDNGQRGKPLRIPLSFEEALKAAVETKPPKPPTGGKAPKKKRERRR